MNTPRSTHTHRRAWLGALPTERNASIFLLEPGRFWEIVVTIPIGKVTSLRTYRILVQSPPGGVPANVAPA